MKIKNYDEQKLKDFISKYAPVCPPPTSALETQIISQIKMIQNNHNHTVQPNHYFKYNFKFVLVLSLILILLLGFFVYFKFIYNPLLKENIYMSDLDSFIEEVFDDDLELNDIEINFIN